MNLTIYAVDPPLLGGGTADWPYPARAWVHQGDSCWAAVASDGGSSVDDVPPSAELLWFRDAAGNSLEYVCASPKGLDEAREEWSA